MQLVEGPASSTVVGLSNMSEVVQQFIATKTAWKSLKSGNEHNRLHAAIKSYLYKQHTEYKRKKENTTAADAADVVDTTIANTNTE